MTTHCRVLWLTPRSRWIDGKATFTMATSRTTMNCAAHVSARIRFLAPLRGVVTMSPPRSGVCQNDERRVAESTLWLLQYSALAFNKHACESQGKRAYWCCDTWLRAVLRSGPGAGP